MSQKMKEIHEKYMYRALELAGRALGRTNPNPLVGAVIVKNGLIIGEGYHQKAGTPHAEIHALEEAGSEARDATMYVTLEPCSHYGKTPPCAEAIVASGIQEVVIATLDQNPKVAGRGLKILQKAGIKTTVGILEEKAKVQNEVFFKYINTKLPFVCMKYAMTLDGKIATHTGNSRWVSNEESRKYVHQLRNVYDAILVGIGTVLLDNPMLNTRLDLPDKKDPIRVIIDGALEIPLDSNIVKTAHSQKTIIFTATIKNKNKAKQLSDAGIELIEISGKLDCLNVTEVLNKLGEFGITSILVEGGAQINASFMQDKLVDKVLCFIAPKIVGGIAPSPVTGQGVNLMQDAYLLESIEIEKIGNDTLIKAYTGW
ncbi:MAG TPA: bifunctional diaminohydroxyphosphoribosylaminopyrimidine deaminase/5-amino-6-(5-phosphoribosylamino)uracil reductase RibD [Syntrophomonadaceae bacterium]|nr:bifunctional diaminohydroxyphosphoribosylaminopyrimidine deaminase/5-amino-6-(5-phosphoribosylamino)uracil reductase RibD [Syntrophomonadaceae bacterium]